MSDTLTCAEILYQRDTHHTHSHVCQRERGHDTISLRVNKLAVKLAGHEIGTDDYIEELAVIYEDARHHCAFCPFVWP